MVNNTWLSPLGRRYSSSACLLPEGSDKRDEYAQKEISPHQFAPRVAGARLAVMGCVRTTAAIAKAGFRRAGKGRGAQPRGHQPPARLVFAKGLGVSTVETGAPLTRYTLFHL